MGLCTVRWRLTLSHHCPLPLFERGILLVGQGFLLSRFDRVDSLNIGAAILGFKAPAAGVLDNRLVVTAGCHHSGFNAANDCIHRSATCWRIAMWLINTLPPLFLQKIYDSFQQLSKNTSSLYACVQPVDKMVNSFHFYYLKPMPTAPENNIEITQEIAITSFRTDYMKANKNHDTLQTRPMMCHYCGDLPTMDHILLVCDLVQEIRKHCYEADFQRTLGLKCWRFWSLITWKRWDSTLYLTVIYQH